MSGAPATEEGKFSLVTAHDTLIKVKMDCEKSQNVFVHCMYSMYANGSIFTKLPFY
jgi:hypothetical protein